jgi:hypothetical protein
MKDPFNSSVRDEYVHFISPLENTTSKKKQLMPPYEILWMSLTSDDGPIEKRKGSSM